MQQKQPDTFNETKQTATKNGAHTSRVIQNHGARGRPTALRGLAVSLREKQKRKSGEGTEGELRHETCAHNEQNHQQRRAVFRAAKDKHNMRDYLGTGFVKRG